MKNKQSGYIVPVLIVIIAILAIGGGVYIYNTKTSKPSDVASTQTLPVTTTTNSDLQTYTNDEYNFSFSYPSTWTVGSRSASNLDMFSIPLTAKQALADYKQKYGNDSISMAAVGISLSSLDAKAWYQQNMGGSANDGRQLTINGYSAYYVKQANSSTVDIDYVISHNGLILRFTMRTYDHGTNLNGTGQPWTNDYSAYLPDFEKIVNSIQFSNQPQSIPPTTSSAPTPIAVPGMSHYTDQSFGFSLWYPSAWAVQSIPVKTNYTGGTVQKTLVMAPPSAPIDQNGSNGDAVTINEFYSPTSEITIPSDLCSPMSGSTVPAHRYYFDFSAHTWMVEVPAYTGESEKDGSQYSVPASTKAADVSTNTMGGLHMLGAGCSGSVIPLSAHNFVVFTFYSRNVGQYYINIAQTITATDPSVATPVSSSEQIKTITSAGILLDAIGTKVGEWHVTNDYVYNSLGTIVVGANPSTFRVITGFSDGYTAQATGFATDGVHIYSSWFYDHPVLDGADPATFVPIHAYYQIPYAQSSGKYGQSFQSDDTHFAKDKSHVWYEGKLIPNADPNTFVVTGDTHVQNSYGIYTLAHDSRHVYGLDDKDNFTIDNAAVKL